MLKKIRIILAALCFVCLTLLFVGIGHDWWGWLARLQLLPAVTRLIGSATLGNIAVVLGILLITWLFGRIYCSVCCPLGVFQDIVIWLRRTLGKKIKPLRKKFNFNKERRWVRYPVLALYIACLIVDVQLLTAILGPYSAYGRMVMAVAGGGAAPFLIAAGITCVVIVLCSWLWGREWCNSICPVGTFLGCFSKFALFRVHVNTDKCVKCGACEHVCKASCIDISTQTVDSSRCVDCFDCIGTCKLSAIQFGRPRPSTAPHNASPSPADSRGSALSFEEGLRRSEATTGGVSGGTLSAFAHTLPPGGKPPTPRGLVPWGCRGIAVVQNRRAFLKASTVLISGATAGFVAGAQEMKVDGGLAPMEAKTPVAREPRLVPPGAKSVKNFYDKCTACQLCLAACPNGVLRPSADLDHLLQPQMGYENGFCRPECTACSQICPTGAILPVQRDAKTLIHIGVAVVNTELCLAANNEAGCGKCASECPMGAISMVTVEGSEAGGVGGVQGDSSSTGRQRRPVVTDTQCIGCGKCEYLCPSRPVSAITVKGLETHRSE